MTLTEVLELIETLRAVEGDTVHIEAKKASKGLPRRLWETLSAFSNTPGGGIIILGLDEETGFSLVGVEDPQRIQSDLASLCDQMEPPLRPLIEIHILNGRSLVTAEIPELPIEQKPCYYRGAGLTNGAFIRVADGDRRLTPYEVQVMLTSRGQPREDEAPVPDARLEDLDPLLISRYLERLRNDEASPFRTMSDQEGLRTLRVLVRSYDQDELWVPSLAGLLTLGKYPQRFFPSLGIVFVVYPANEIGVPGPGGERFLDNRRIDGPIPTMVIKVLDALKRNMKRRAVVRGRFREDVWEYPEDALREAIVNALGHRDYSPTARGTPVQVQMFPDRLIIANPGGLFGPVTVDRLGETGVSAARNQTVMRILEDLPATGENRTLCENRGSGIGAMLASLRQAGMKPPEFENAIAAFRVVFPNHTLLDDTIVEKPSQFPSRKRKNRKQDIISMLRIEGPLSRREIAGRLGIGDAGALRWLNLLIQEDIIETTTPPRSRHQRYRLRDDNR